MELCLLNFLILVEIWYFLKLYTPLKIYFENNYFKNISFFE